MHSGMLFLFPHIFRVCLAAKRCGSLDFVSVDDMWWRGGEMASSSMAAPFESHCDNSQPRISTSSQSEPLYVRSFRVAHLDGDWMTSPAPHPVPLYVRSFRVRIPLRLRNMQSRRTKPSDRFS